MLVLSDGEAITMVVCITRQKKAHKKAPMLIFVNKSCNYPIQGPPDNVACVYY